MYLEKILFISKSKGFLDIYKEISNFFMADFILYKKIDGSKTIIFIVISMPLVFVGINK